jgi:hypothetical protein
MDEWTEENEKSFNRMLGIDDSIKGNKMPKWDEK